ncbi:galactosyl transferase [Diplogelasinospora grovesii]|uniref:Galactosyl transferase n=1 Tax=Diplogelasinospora grovesii TaxID=303347 RepID=A0AAN6MYC6_9PEZI|nr:galactosyl transferase [Diplogelasinospora grovesii]
MVVWSLQRPARIISVVAAVCCLWIWYLNFVRDVDLSCAFVPAGLRLDKVGTGSERQLKTSRVGKVTVAANKLDAPVIYRALQSHQRHNDMHGYQHFIAMNEVVSSLTENDHQNRPRGAWTKPAYLLSVLVAELQKPENERLKWVFWFDADTIIVNPHTPLETFLPPEDNRYLGSLELILSSNWDGLNSGVFALRVSPWSVSLLSAILAYPIYEAARLPTDRFRDQSAFQFLLEEDNSPLAVGSMKGRDRWIEVPMRWFNSLPINNAFYANGSWIFAGNMTDGLFDNGTTQVFDDGHGGQVNPWKVMQGDMVVHFAGSSYVRDSWMAPWLTRAEAELPEWSNATTQWVLKNETDQFWAAAAQHILADRKKAAQNLKDRIEQEKQEAAKLDREKKEREKQEKEKEDKEKEDKAEQEKAKQVKEKQEKKNLEQEERDKAAELEDQKSPSREGSDRGAAPQPPSVPTA